MYLRFLIFVLKFPSVSGKEVEVYNKKPGNAGLVVMRTIYSFAAWATVACAATALL